MHQIDVGDFFVVAEEMLHMPAERLMDDPCVLERALAALSRPYASFMGLPLYPDVVDRAAVLAFGIVREQPLPRRNAAVAYLLMREQLTREGATWDESSHPSETADVFERIGLRMMTELEFRQWVGARATSESTVSRVHRVAIRVIARFFAQYA